MNRRIAHVTVVVDDYDKAIEFYVEKLNFKLVEDTRLSSEKRWVLLSPDSSFSCNLLLAKAKNSSELSRVGNQTGGRVFLFLYTDDFQAEYDNLISHSIEIVRQPTKEPYGTVAVFADLYGNLWDLIEPNVHHR